MDLCGSVKKWIREGRAGQKWTPDHTPVKEKNVWSNWESGRGKREGSNSFHPNTWGGSKSSIPRGRERAKVRVIREVLSIRNSNSNQEGKESPDRCRLTKDCKPPGEAHSAYNETGMVEVRKQC